MIDVLEELEVIGDNDYGDFEQALLEIDRTLKNNKTLTLKDREKYCKIKVDTLIKLVKAHIKFNECTSLKKSLLDITNTARNIKDDNYKIEIIYTLFSILKSFNYNVSIECSSLCIKNIVNITSSISKRNKRIIIPSIIKSCEDLYNDKMYKASIESFKYVLKIAKNDDRAYVLFMIGRNYEKISMHKKAKYYYKRYVDVSEEFNIYKSETSYEKNVLLTMGCLIVSVIFCFLPIHQLFSEDPSWIFIVFSSVISILSFINYRECERKIIELVLEMVKKSKYILDIGKVYKLNKKEIIKNTIVHNFSRQEQVIEQKESFLTNIRVDKNNPSSYLVAGENLYIKRDNCNGENLDSIMVLDKEMNFMGNLSEKLAKDLVNELDKGTRYEIVIYEVCDYTDYLGVMLRFKRYKEEMKIGNNQGKSNSVYIKDDSCEEGINIQ